MEGSENSFWAGEESEMSPPLIRLISRHLGANAARSLLVTDIEYSTVGAI